MINLHGGTGNGNPNATVVSSTGSSSSKRKTTKRTIDGDNSDNLEREPPKKWGRPFAYHAYQPCGPCSIWLQTGRDVRLVHHHVSDRMGHPGKNAVDVGIRITTRSKPDSCVCKGCQLDFLHNKNNHGCPRWQRLRDDTYTQRHRMLCCTTGTSCQCNKSPRMGSIHMVRWPIGRVVGQVLHTQWYVSFR